MSTLQDMLANYAVESGLIDAEGNTTEEITVVTNDTVTELENEIDDVSEKISDAHRDMDQVVEASDAILATESLLVGHINRLRDPEAAGQYTRLAQELTWSGVVETMEAYKFPQAIYGDIVDGMSFEADEPAAQAGKDAEKADGVLKKLWAMLQKAAAAVKAMFIRFLDLFRTNNEKNKRSVDILKAELAKRSDKLKNADAKISNSGWTDLSVNGKIDVPAALALVGKGYSEDLKAAQVKIKETIVQVSDIMKRDNHAGMVDALLKTLNIRKGDEVEASKVLNKFLESFPKDFSFALPGGRKGEYSVVRKSSGAAEVKFEITKPSAKLEGDHPVPSIQYVENILTVLKANTETVETINKSIQDNITETDKLLEAAKVMAAKPGATKEQEAPLKAVGNAATALVNSSKVFLPKYNSYALNVGHDAYKYGLKVLSMYEAKGKEPKAAE